MRKKILRLSLATLALAGVMTVQAKPASASTLTGCPTGSQDIWLNVGGGGFFDCYYLYGLTCSDCAYYCPDVGAQVDVNMCEE